MPLADAISRSTGTEAAPAGLGVGAASPRAGESGSIAVRAGPCPDSTPLHDVTFVVIDVETTGGSPSTGSLTEVAAARYRGGELTGTFRSFVRPDERISPFVVALTGITDGMVADAPTAGQILPSLLEFVGRDVLVGHNLRFDLSFLDHALRWTERQCLENPVVDTLAMARHLVADELPNCQLATLARGLGLEHRPAHRALADVLATGDLLHVLLERAGSFGIMDLGELLALPRLLGHPQARKLRTTVSLPRRPGLFWLSDARGRVLFVDHADDVRKAARSLFFVERDRRTNRLLRQMYSAESNCPTDTESIPTLFHALLDRWNPPFNQPESSRSRPRPRPRPRTKVAA